MEQLKQLLQESISEKLIGMTISNPTNKDGVIKIKVRQVCIKDERHFQIESFTKTQAFQKNVTKEEAIGVISELVLGYKQVQIETQSLLASALVSKKGKVTIKKKQKQNETKEVEIKHHNRTKNYILKEGTRVPFLEELGVMTKEGKIVKSKYDKFKQINRYLEFIEDVLPQLPKDREVNIIDFGCGKSYLTFAMYYYLKELKNYDVKIIGLDLKEKVIEHCTELAKKYGYEKLSFQQGDITNYQKDDEKVDMVVTLHACDTATDIALAKAVKWNAKVILSVPCCQHELNSQIKSEVLEPVLKYGLIKERMAALITDGLRASYLESQGYEMQVMEFIDMEHTPKNILLRGIKTGKKVQNTTEIQNCKSLLNINPTIETLLNT